MSTNDHSVVVLFREVEFKTRLGKVLDFKGKRLTMSRGNEVNKADKLQMIMNAIKNSGRNYEILDGNAQAPKHIRVKGWGDIWPSTGTYKKGKKFVRKNVPQLIQALGSDYIEPKKKVKIDVEAILKRLDALEEYIAHVEHKIDFPLG